MEPEVDDGKFTIDEAMRRAWPDGIPAEELMTRARLTEGQSDKLAGRLEAVRLWTEGVGDQRPSNAREAAASAGVAVAQFQRLAAAWRSSRSLVVLGVNSSRRRTAERMAGGMDRQAVLDRIRMLLAEDPELRPLSLRRRLEADGFGDMSDASLLRLMSDARRLLPPGVFGERLVFDSAGMDFVDPEGLRIRLHCVIDHGTRIVLGWAVATERTRAMGHVWAADDALERLPAIDLKGLRVSDAEPMLDFRLDVEDVHARRAFDDAFGRPPSLGRATRTLGSTIVDAVGERLADIWLGTGSRAPDVAFRTGRTGPLPEYTATIDWTLEPALERHNAARMTKVEPPFDDEDRIDASRDRVGKALRRVLGAENTILSLPGYEWMRNDGS